MEYFAIYTIRTKKDVFFAGGWSENGGFRFCVGDSDVDRIFKKTYNKANGYTDV